MIWLKSQFRLHTRFCHSSKQNRSIDFFLLFVVYEIFIDYSWIQHFTIIISALEYFQIRIKFNFTDSLFVHVHNITRYLCFSCRFIPTLFALEDISVWSIKLIQLLSISHKWSVRIWPKKARFSPRSFWITYASLEIKLHNIFCVKNLFKTSAFISKQLTSKILQVRDSFD